MKFDLDAVFVEDGCANSALATRVLRALPHGVPVTHVDDAREVSRPEPGAPDPFGAGKRRLVIARRKTPFLMPCPAGSSKFACCGYLVLTLASNCPMDCSYCFLQEYLADNPAFQVYANYTDSFDELDKLTAPTLTGAASASAPASWRTRSRSIRSPRLAATWSNFLPRARI